MGQEFSKPKAGTKFRVIGAGLSRTGTTSFTAALSILLDSPVYHGATQVTLGPEVEIKSWINILQHWPARNAADASAIRDLSAQRLAGYAAATDVPFYGLVPELMELYPDALVICSTRDPKSWAESVAKVARSMHAPSQLFQRVVLFPLPAMRYWVDFITQVRRKSGAPQDATEETYHEHIRWLKKVVPPERLVFFNVKDGWGPLCEALGKPVPDVPFPHVNEADALDAFAKRQIRKGLQAWAGILTVVVGAPLAAWWVMRR